MMANNRMYLRCKACGKEIFLGKRLTNGYWIEQYPQWEKPFIDMLNDFYNEHTYCNGEGEDCFEIHYESFVEYCGTNADRIRSMSDEELAHFISEDYYVPHCPTNGPCLVEGDHEGCKECWLKWLKEEYKNE